MSIDENDTVIEIGPGKGIITKELIPRSRQVLAVELDSTLLPILLNSIQTPKLTLFCADFLDFPLPVTNYAVVSNTPFAIEGKILRKLLAAGNPPESVYLVVRADVGKRWAGENREGAFSVSHKPWFDFKVVHHFKRTDFIPVPSVDSVLLAINKKVKPLLDSKERDQFAQFVTTVFGSGSKLSHGLKKFGTKKQVRVISQQLQFSLRAKPTQLSVEEWVRLYLQLGKK